MSRVYRIYVEKRKDYAVEVSNGSAQIVDAKAAAPKAETKPAAKTAEKKAPAAKKPAAKK